jgi:hypothetical protein
MVNLLSALRWRMSKKPENRTRWKIFKYNFFGSGHEVFQHDLAYQFADAAQIRGNPLYVNDSDLIFGLASIIAEMEGRRFLSMFHPCPNMSKEEKAKIVNYELEKAINSVVTYLIPDNMKPSQYETVDYDESRRYTLTGEPMRMRTRHVSSATISKCREDLNEQFKRMLKILEEDTARKAESRLK